ncbi:LDCC motif putative metal-binding protein [Clostridium aestuarii]|uniref:LDCC motif putative metal-binding protein n=1 Tax=Clostridium aestuarii TaxID=338193 RepID=A0ABT4D2W5_9CLOT|nr:LDCC motif putative metal-binding protein [Clostridium aestuarii]MCY6485566.1 LDCC motif putative metal-binding protein [Clostridium aestuarii]
MKKWFKNFIKKIAVENEKSFGSEKLDCCGLNTNKKNNNKNQSKKK